MYNYQKVNVIIVSLFYFILNFFYSFLKEDRERQSVSRGEAEREGDTESEAGFRL